MPKPLDYAIEPKGTIAEPPRTIVVTVDFEIGDIVYLKVRDEPMRGMITGINLRPSGLLYQVSWGASGCEAFHFALELSTEPEL